MYKLLNVLGDKTRIEIIKQIKIRSDLEKSELVCACDMLEELACSQSTLSHHLKVLTENEILIREKNGKYCHYQINKKKIEEIITFFETIKGDVR